MWNPPWLAQSIRLSALPAETIAMLGGLAGIEDYKFFKARQTDKDLLKYYGILVDDLSVKAVPKASPTVDAGNVGGVIGSPSNLSRYFGEYDKYVVADALLKKGRRSGKTIGYIGGVEVTRDHLRVGLGRKLMEHWIREARALGVGDIYLEAYPYEAYSPSLDALKTFYGSLGFVIEPSMAGDGVFMVLKARRESTRALRATA